MITDWESIDCCLHQLDEDDTCMLCGLCSNNIRLEDKYEIAFHKQHIVPRNNKTYPYSRKINSFIQVMNLRSGKQPLDLKDKDKRILQQVITFLYKDDYNERKVKDVIKKLKLYKHINNSYLIFCILKNIPCLRFDEYESYFEYVYTKMYEQYIKMYPHKYFISSGFVLNQLLNEVGIQSKYYFKNIHTFDDHNNIYKNIRNIVNISYSEFISPTKKAT
jgi:hypothetical protein